MSIKKDNHTSTTPWTIIVRVTNSRLPVYKATYRDGLVMLFCCFFFVRMAPKIAQILKLSMKAISVKVTGAIDDIAEKAFSAAKDRLVRLIGGKPSTVK